MITKLISKIIGDPNEKEIKRCHKIVQKINSIEKKYESFDEAAVKAKTQEFKQRIANSEPLDQLLPEAYALVKRACRLLKGKSFTVRGHDMVWDMVPYDVQLIGGIFLHEGKITEMKTGEGKTLVASLPFYLNALEGKGAYLVTVNDYLALRDAEWMGFLYNFLGLTVGTIYHGQSPQEKKTAYNADITYGTNNEFGFDYLRDNMASSKEDRVQRGLHFALIDEVDSILIDEARTPLIISAPAGGSTEKYQKYSRLVTQLDPEKHYTVDEKSRSCILTDDGIRKMESLLGMSNIYTEAGATEVHHIEQALKAQTLFQRDVDYMLQDGAVTIIDEFTGRLMPGRRYSQGLHQAIEAKEGVHIKQESKTLATITFQNYFRLFKKLAGMTGTAITEAEEFSNIYSLETIVIPTNVPIQRKDSNDLIYKTAFGKFQAVTKRVKELQEKGQPVLVGTISVEKSELLSKMFQQSGIKHEVLNAKHHEREAEIIAGAGKKSSVTIATNMAGRGTDIKINDEVKDLGGLVILGTERHESRRIDNQLRGRSGRQGDPGESQFYVSMEDELMRLFGGERMKAIMEALKVPEDMPIENRFISRSIESAQKRVEGHNFDIRKHLVEYDDVMNKHRTIVYSRRQKILENENVHDLVIDLINETSKDLSSNHTQGKQIEHWKLTELIEDIHGISGLDTSLYEDQILKLEKASEIQDYISHLLIDDFIEKKNTFNNDDSFFNIERQVYLRTIDRLWMEHIDEMVRLREQVSFRGYAQKDPLVEYKNEGFSKFESLIKMIQVNTVQTLLKMELKQVVPRETVKKIETNEDEIVDIQTGDRELIPTHKTRTGRPTIISADDIAGHDPLIQKAVFGSNHEDMNGNAIRIQADEGIVVRQVSSDQDSQQSKSSYPKSGRNDPCPCGSGKKYKKCHGS